MGKKFESEKYNTNRIFNYSTFLSNQDDNLEELKDIKRKTVKNDKELKHIPGNTTNVYNKVTKKIDSVSPEELKDKIQSLEDNESED